jgi:hypothetical protein
LLVRITRGDGLIYVDQAAELCGVETVTVRNWINRGYIVTIVIDGEKVRERHYLPVAKRENGLILLDPVDVAKAEYATRKAARRDPIREALPVAA